LLLLRLLMLLLWWWLVLLMLLLVGLVGGLELLLALGSGVIRRLWRLAHLPWGFVGRTLTISRCGIGPCPSTWCWRAGVLVC
jgi:hypothetical protein